MNKDMEILIKCLVTQDNLYSEILKLSVDKRKMIIDNNVDSINEIISKEEKILSQLSDVESIRINCTNRIGSRMGIEENVTISKIIAYSGEYEKELREKCDAISETLRKLRAANDLNSELIEAQLEYIDTIKGIIINDTNNNYSVNGKDIKEHKQNINLFDRTV